MKSLTCPKHNSPIGGVCNDSTCKNANQLLCMTCVSDPLSCVRSQRHTFIPVFEYVDQFFTKDFSQLKNDTHTASSINNVEKFCKEYENIHANFVNQKEEIGSEVVEMYKSFIGHLNNLFVNFNQFYIQFIEEKEESLKKSLLNLLKIMKYEELSHLEINSLKENMERMSFQDLNNTVVNMKEVLGNLKAEAHTSDEEIVKQMVQLNNEKIIKYFRDECTNFMKEAETKFNLYKSKIKESLFKEEILEIKSLSQLKQIYDDPIDFSPNSNFLTKKFTIFEHSNGHTLFAYPTSQNTIKIEYFDKFINDEKKAIEAKQPKPNIMQAMNLTVRDKWLYFTLSSHGGKIIDLIYYRKEQSDYLISSSEDGAIKIWDITKLSAYLNNVNEYYKSNCVKTLLGHQGKIIAMKVYYDPLHCTNLIVSIGYMDKIKVWNMLTGQFIRDLSDANKGSHDNLLCLAYLDKQNYMFTGNSTSKLIKVWDFDRGEIQKVINYGQNKKIVDICFDEDVARLFVLDDTGLCAYANLKTIDSSLKLEVASLEDCGCERSGFVKWDNDILIVYCKNGMIYQYDMRTGKIVDKLKIANTFISYAMNFIHITKKKVLLIHSGDQHLKIFN